MINHEYKLKFKINSKRFFRTLSNPRVYIFIIIGIAIIFLTFLTDDNAMEIAISGFASVFIGIGVNNFTSIETRLKDERKINSKIGHSIKIMEIAHSKICRLRKEISIGNYQKIMDDFQDLEQYMKLGSRIIEDELTAGIMHKKEVDGSFSSHLSADE